MKKLVLIGLTSIMFNINAYSASSDGKRIINQLTLLNGAQGKIISNIENETTGVCKISTEQNDDGVSVSFENTGLYFTPIAHVSINDKVVNKTTLLISTNSDRPGGDACGDSGGSVRYKKTISVTDKEVKIEESFRCTFEGLKKYILTSTCKLN